MSLVFVTNWITNCNALWEEPSMAAYFDRLARFYSVICFDKRGSGVSDPVPLGELPRLEEWMDDVSTVMDAAPGRTRRARGGHRGRHDGHDVRRLAAGSSFIARPRE